MNELFTGKIAGKVYFAGQLVKRGSELAAYIVAKEELEAGYYTKTNTKIMEKHYSLAAKQAHSLVSGRGLKVEFFCSELLEEDGS